MENLEKLNLMECLNLEELDSSIGCLQKLVQLNLGRCTRLKRFPWETISNLTSLQRLDLWKCPNILEISHEVGTLKSLKYLNLSWNNFHSLPDSICQLHQLTELILSYNNFHSLPDSLCQLHQLVELYVTDCSELQSLPLLPSNLTVLEASGCRSLEVMQFDSEQMTYTIHSKIFKVSNPSIPPSLAGYLCIGVSGEVIPGWCSGVWIHLGPFAAMALSFVAPINDNRKICGVILCADLNTDVFPKMLNKTKEASHCFKGSLFYNCKMCIMFYPLDDTTLVVEAGDTVELHFGKNYVSSCGLRLIYEDDVFDSKLVIQNVTEPTLCVPSEMMTASITHLNDEEVCSFSSRHQI